jgi:hypothetical protein
MISVGLGISISLYRQSFGLQILSKKDLHGPQGDPHNDRVNVAYMQHTEVHSLSIQKLCAARAVE